MKAWERVEDATVEPTPTTELVVLDDLGEVVELSASARQEAAATRALVEQWVRQGGWI
jgi:hypothetical protein